MLFLGLLVASITSRKSKCVESLTFVNEYNSLDVCPTLIATIPFQVNDKVISVKHNRRSMLAGQEMEKFVSTDKFKIFKHAIIILHPEKLSSQPLVRPFNFFYNTI